MKKGLIFAGTIVFFLMVSNLHCIAEDGEIIACKRKNGTFRIVDDHSKCRKREEPIVFNVKGDPGEQGPEGPPGPPSVCDTSITDALQDQIDILQTQIDYLAVLNAPSSDEELRIVRGTINLVVA